MWKSESNFLGLVLSLKQWDLRNQASKAPLPVESSLQPKHDSLFIRDLIDLGFWHFYLLSIVPTVSVQDSMLLLVQLLKTFMLGMTCLWAAWLSTLKEPYVIWGPRLSAGGTHSSWLANPFLVKTGNSKDRFELTLVLSWKGRFFFLASDPEISNSGPRSKHGNICYQRQCLWLRKVYRGSVSQFAQGIPSLCPVFWQCL